MACIKTDSHRIYRLTFTHNKILKTYENPIYDNEVKQMNYY